MRFVRLSWITKGPGRAWVGSVPNKHNPSTKSGQDACISSRITMVIHVMNDHQINDNCFNEPFAVSPCRSLYWDMHGLIFETSIWLLAGSTRLLLCPKKAFHPNPLTCVRESKANMLSTGRELQELTTPKWWNSTNRMPKHRLICLDLILQSDWREYRTSPTLHSCFHWVTHAYWRTPTPKCAHNVAHNH